MDFVDFSARRRQNSIMRWLFLFLLLITSASAAEPGEAEAFAAAAKASQDGFSERAEKAWSEFLAKFPKSERKPEAILAQAQARHQMKNFPAALELLTTKLPEAGALADQFRFWRGQTLLDMTNYVGAEEAFAELLKNDTNSPLRLNAAVSQGMARFRKDDFTGVAELLGNTNGVFQQLAAAATNVSQVARGALILAESQLRRTNLIAARTALQSLAGKPLPPEVDWDRSQLLARVELAGANPEAALPALTNALTQARALKRPALVAQTLNLEADVHRKLNRLDRAALAYGSIVAEIGMPLDHRRIALLKQVELLATQRVYTNAAGRIAVFLTQNTNEPASDSLQIKAGEFLLEAYRGQTNKVVAPATNYLAEARAFFDATIQQHTNSPLLGRAWLNKGWTLWEEHEATGNRQRLAEGQASFQVAAEKLPPGDEQALARLKAGDAQFKQEIFSGAATNYEAVLNVPGVRTNIAGRAAEQLVRAYLAQTNLVAAELALQKSVAMFPGMSFAEQSWLTMGQVSAESGDLPRARALLKDFATKFPNSALKVEAELAHARTFALEGKWLEASELYGKWSAAHTNHPGVAQVEFDRARFTWKAGQDTNAFQAFTNFVSRFPKHPLAAQALYAIGDYYFNPPRQQWSLAEQNYQQVFQSTNWNRPDLACQARLAAASSAFYRQGYDDAQSYLTNLLNAACSQDIIAEGLFLLGDVLTEKRITGGTNKLDNFQQAMVPFKRITLMGPTNRFEPLAWGRIGDCQLQLASEYPESYTEATNAYFKVLESKRTDVPPAARKQAKVGIALALEKRAEGRPPKEAAALLDQALTHLLDIVYAADPNDPPEDWLKRAAQNAARLAERIKPAAARELYTRLMTLIPSMKATWEAKRAELPEVISQ